MGPKIWPPNFPDLNQVHYGIYYRNVFYSKLIHDLKELKQRLVNMWVDVKQSVVEKAIEQRWRRLQAGVRAEGRCVKHML